MPIYPIKCACGFAGDVFAKIAEVKRYKGKVLCPECGDPAEQDYANKSVGFQGNELHGTRQESMDVQAQPHEVGKLRRLYGDIGRCWQPDGTVKFKDKDDAKAFFRKDDEIRRQNREAKAEREAKGIFKPTKRERVLGRKPKPQ